MNAIGDHEAPLKSTGLRYRPDIDGLTAVAVLLVVAFHADFRLPPGITHWVARHLSTRLASRLAYGVTGGYIGVDIFFVISGFLISSILFREQQDNTFSIVRFYERRIRRIFPALTAVLVFMLIVGFLAIKPPEMKDLANSTLAATFSFANLYFWKTSGYFDAPALAKPLLHTWSLAVEEQFYLVFPVLLLVLRRLFPRRFGVAFKVAILVLAAASLAASAVGVYRDPNAAFYLPQTRAWELFAGVIVAMGIVPPPASKLSRNLASLAGLGLIFFAAIHFTAATRFPGPAALLPCLGAALTIAAGITGESFVGRVLSLKPVVFVGLISYSLYLWHWPLLLIDNYEYFPGFHPSMPWLFLIMLAAATLSWRFVEQPFRSGPLKLPRTQLFAGAAFAAALLTVFCLWAIASNGIPSRLTPDAHNLAGYIASGPLDAQWGQGCFVSTEGSSIQPRCLAVGPTRPNYLLFGDSHAAHLWYGLSTAFPEIHFAEATASNCKPLLASSASPDAFCRRLVDTVFNHFLPAHPVDVVVLSCIWSEQDMVPLGETVARLHQLGLRVYIIGPIFYYDQPLPDLLIKAARGSDPKIVARHFVRDPAMCKWLDDQLAAVALKHGAARYISLVDALCDPTGCVEYVSPGVPLQFDAAHFTNAGSLLVAERLRASHQLP